MKSLSVEQITRINQKVIRRLETGRTESALKILQENGLHEEAQLIQNPPERLVQHDLQCPAHRTVVATGCRAKDCKFWVQSSMANNCLLAYCHHQQIDRLSADEIAYLYEQPVDVVRRELDDAMQTLRITAIQSDSASDPDIQRVFWFVPSSTVCCVCGSLTDPKTLQRVPETPLAYCSPECAEESPPESVSVEYRFGRPIGTVIRWALRRFKNLPVLERTLGLKRETLTELTRRHVGRDLQTIFPKAKMRSERPPWRRKVDRSAFLALMDKTKHATDKQTKRFGQAIFGIDRLRLNLQAILA